MNTRLWARWIELASWAFALLGLALPFAFESAALAAYRNALASWTYGSSTLAVADRDTLTLMLGILGGSIAGKWTVHALLARGPLAEGRAWARTLSLIGLAAWFAVDSVASVLLGATFNVWMINFLPLVVVGIPLLLVPVRADAEPTVADANVAGQTSDRDGRWAWLGTPQTCFWASVFGATTGLVIGFGADTPMFWMWFAGLEDAHYGGQALADPSRRLATFFFGPIGGCTLAQFAMLAGFVRTEGRSMRVAMAGALSISAWFLIDSGYGLAHRGLFNIALVNVPAAVLTLPPWLAMAARLRGPTR